MRSYVVLKNEQTVPLPPDIPGPDVRYSESFVRYLLENFTQPGDTVFDPFAGFGTTLTVAEAMGRNPSGIEYNSQRFQYAQSRLQKPDHLLHGDARRLSGYALPSFALSLTSPPYMGRYDTENPLTDYSTPGGGYEAYLADLRGIYQQASRLMRENARVILEIANLKPESKQSGGLTTLAWDVAASLSHVLYFEGEIVVGWEPTYGHGYDHSYCLVFSKRVIEGSS